MPKLELPDNRGIKKGKHWLAIKLVSGREYLVLKVKMIPKKTVFRDLHFRMRQNEVMWFAQSA